MKTIEFNERKYKRIIKGLYRDISGCSQQDEFPYKDLYHAYENAFYELQELIDNALANPLGGTNG